MHYKLDIVIKRNYTLIRFIFGFVPFGQSLFYCLFFLHIGEHLQLFNNLYHIAHINRACNTMSRNTFTENEKKMEVIYFLYRGKKWKMKSLK